MKTKLSTLTGCAFAVCIWAAGAHAKDFGDGLENLSPSRILNNQDGRYDHWRGIGRIRSDNGRACTATLIDTRSADSDARGPAYVLTSGHCLYRKNNGVMLSDSPVSGTVTFNYFVDTVDHQQPYPLKRVNWSSMQGVDLAIVELQASLDSLILAGIQPLAIAEQVPEVGSDVLVAGAPLPFETPYLRMAACSQQSAIEVIKQPWVWRHVVKNQCRDIEQGSSGSPVLTRDSNKVFAVLNTTTLAKAGGGPNAVPTPDVAAPDQAGNFGNPVSYLRSCFVDGEFNNDPRICPLFPTFSIEFAANGQPKPYAKIKLDAEGKTIYPAWNVAFSIDKPLYRYKAVRRALECEDPDHYSHTITATDARIDASIGPQPGVNMLCILGVDSADERPFQGLMRNALTLATELQIASPPSAPDLKISQRGDLYTVTWESGPLIGKHTFKVGPHESTDCNDPAGYANAWRPLRPRAHHLPLKVCTYAYDHAGQRSEVREDVLTKQAGEAGEISSPHPKTIILQMGKQADSASLKR